MKSNELVRIQQIDEAQVVRDQAPDSLASKNSGLHNSWRSPLRLLVGPSVRPKIPSDEHEVIHDFLTVGEGLSLAQDFRIDPIDSSDSSSPPSVLSSIPLGLFSDSSPSHTLAEYGGILSHLIHKISNHTALYYTRIIATESYSEPIRLGVYHRFLLLELARPEKKTLWLRLDRRRSKRSGPFQFVWSGGSTSAYDTINLSSSKDVLTENAHRENRQTFASLPTLSQLVHLLDVIVEKLSTYEIWPHNCWFFVSLLQEHLSLLSTSTFEVGGLEFQYLDPNIRKEIGDEVQKLRTRNAMHRLETMLASTIHPRDELPLVEIFSSSDVAYYIRHVLRAVPLRDLSLVDKLVNTAEHDFTSAVAACAHVQFGAKYGPAGRMRILLDLHTDSLSLSNDVFDYTLENLDVEIFTQLQRDRSFAAIVNTRRPRSWPHLCELNRCIARACLHTMDKLLRFNICSFPSSYIENNNPCIQHLFENAQSKEHITSALVYACSHWAYHSSFGLLDLAELIIHVLENHALHWLEILSLTGTDAPFALRPLSKLHITHGQLRDIVRDLAAFIEIFSEPIARSVPHIYLSAFLFSPLESSLRQTLSTTVPLHLISPRVRNWDTLQMLCSFPETRTSSGWARALAFSSNSMKFTYVCDDGVLGVWDGQTWDTMTRKLEPIDKIHCAAFSAGGNRLVTTTLGLETSLRGIERFPQLWDLEESDANIGAPMVGQEGAIWSVAISPDGRSIASGSSDGEIRLCNADNPKAIYWPRMGHDRPVRALAFSPDGEQVVSGSDSLVHRWEVSTGFQIGNALHAEGDLGWVESVVYSPSGEQIASGSSGIVRVWDTGTSVLCFEALLTLRHLDHATVKSIAYSSDGRLLASGGGYEGNIHIWDSKYGHLLNYLKLGQQHVSDIVFSPDGARLACRSSHHIHLWELDEEGFGLKDPTGLIDLDETERSYINAVPRTDPNLRKVQ